LRQALSLALVLLMVTHSSPAAFGADTASQISAIPAGSNIEVRLKNKEMLRGTRGDMSGSGFTLLNPPAGIRQVAFEDVTSVKRVDNQKSHVTRNVLVAVGIGLVVILVVAAIHIKNHPLG